MSLYDSTSPLLPYNAIAAGVIPPDVYGIGINYYANRVPLQRRLKHLAVGASQRRPVEAEDGSVKFVSQMTATLSCDHRVVDGALGAQLLAAFKSLIESPVRMLV